MRKVALGLAGLALVVAVMWWLLPSGVGGGKNPAGSASTGVTQAATGAVATAQATAGKESEEQDFAHFVALGEGLGSVPRSLRGTQVDGHVAADASGNLILEVGVKQMFDYFLSALGEENLDAIKGRIAFYLKQHLPASAALQGWSLLGRYLDYRQATSSIEESQKSDGSVAGLRQAEQQRNQLRDSWLGEAASQAFFGPEEAYDDYTLSRMQIMQDESLSDAQKQQQVDQLKAALPDEVRDMIQQTTAPVEAVDTVDAMRAQGASEADIQAYRTSQFGPEAAERFKALDAERAAWQNRYDDYRQQRQSILDAGLAASDQASEIAALRERLFAAGEQKRVAALDDMTTDAASTGKNHDEAKK